MSVLGGAVTNKADASAKAGAYSSSFIGQSVVLDTAYTADLISKTGVASIMKVSPVSGIAFPDKIDAEDPVFATGVVPVELKITSTEGKIRKIKYSISRKGKAFNDWDTDTEREAVEGTDYTYDDDSKTRVTFKKNIDFQDSPTSAIRFYAQTDGGDSSYPNNPPYPYNYSNIYKVRFDGNIDPSSVYIISPDPLAKVTSVDPIIETSMFDLAGSSFNVELKEKGGRVLYDIFVSSAAGQSNPDGVDTVVYNGEKGAIYYRNSDLLKFLGGSYVGPKNLVSGKTYNLKITFKDTKDPVDIDFKVADGGVADILAYPSPFSPKRGQKVTIKYYLAYDSNVTVRIYDKAGKIVCKLQDSVSKKAGADGNEVVWDGRNYAGEMLATGPYICEVIAKGEKGEHRRYTALALVNK